MGSSREIIPIGDIIECSLAGGWGKDAHFSDAVRVAIIRSADFPAIEQGRYGGFVVRFEKRAKVMKAQLRPGDVVIENSGGTDNRPTGRTVLINEALLQEYDCPIIPASFCRVIRFGKSVNSYYAYYWLQDMYNKGRTWSYQNRSTGLSNFQFKVFAVEELVSLPSFENQKKIAVILATIDRKIRLNNRINDYLAA